MRKSDIVVDPRFFVPSNIVDVVQSGRDDEEFLTTGDDVQQPSTEEIPNSGALPTPSVDFTVVSQTLKVAPDGRLTVDVVVELPDNQQGRYEVRTTKIVD